MKTIVNHVLMVFASVVVTLLGIEVAAAIVSPQQLVLLRGDIWRPDDLFGYRHRENASTEVNTAEEPPGSLRTIKGFVSVRWGCDQVQAEHAILLPLNDILETRSHLFILIKEELRSALLPMVLAKSYHPPVFNVGETRSRRWALTAGIFKRIAAEFAERSVPVIFVLIPTIYQVREDLWPEHLALFNVDPSTVKLSQPNVLLGGAFETEGLTLLDPMDVMRREAESGNRHYGSIDPHLNRRGNRSVSEFILPSVEAALSGWYQP